MASEVAEVIDLESYRRRKSQVRSTPEDASLFGDQFDYGQIPQSSFIVPVAFFVFWPTWVLMPSPATFSLREGNGLA
jgi:hypothetical protein